MSRAHRVSPSEGDGLPPSSSDVRARHTPETVRNVPSRGRTTRRRPLIWAVLTWALPPLSTGGGLGLPRPRSALPCHRPALRSRTVTAQVVSRFPLRAIGLRPMARLQAHSRWPDGSRSGSTSSTGSRPSCPAAVAIGVRTPRARPVDPSPAPARGPPGPVPAVRRVGSIVRRVNGEQNVPGSARSGRASAHGAAAHLPEDPDDRRLRRPPRLTGRPR